MALSKPKTCSPRHTTAGSLRPRFYCLPAIAVAFLGSMVHADIDQSLATVTDPRRNLHNLVNALRDAHVTDRGELATVVDRLEAADAAPRDVILTLRSLLPDVSRQKSLLRRTRLHEGPTHLLRLVNDRPSAAQQSPDLPNYLPILRLNDDQRANADPKRSLWLHTYTDSGDQEDDGELEGFEASSWGIAIGADYDLTDRLTIGGSAGHFDGNVDSAQFGEDNQDGEQYGLTMTYAVDRHAFQLAYTYATTDTQRERILIVRTADGFRRLLLESDIESTQQHWSFSYASAFELGDANLLSPTLGLRHSRLATDDYVERGGDSLSLSVDTESETQLTATTGLDLSRLIARGDWYLAPSIGASIDYDLSSDPTTTLSRFRDRQFLFTTQGLDTDRFRWRVHAGLSAAHRGGFSLSIALARDGADDYRNLSAALSLQSRF